MTIKVKATAADFIGRGEYINDYAAGKYGLSAAWFYTEDGESVHRDKLFSLSNEEQRRIIRSHAAREYDYYISGSYDINHYRIDDNKIYTEAFRAKLSRINAVLDTYHYDDSNSMDDYFDTNFYRNITVVAAPRRMILRRYNMRYQVITWTRGTTSGGSCWPKGWGY